MSTEGLVDRAASAILRRISGPIAATLAVILYGVGLAAPLALHWPKVYLVEANALGTVLAFVVVLGWLVLRLEQSTRRHLLEWTTNLRLLTAEEFEWLVGEVFRREGWSVAETGRQDAPDGNVDLILTRGRQRVIVQCKRWQSWRVDTADIRGFAGALLREGLPGSEGVFVTMSDFTQNARDEAKKVGIRLVNKAELYSRIEKVRQAEPCPKCDAPMVVDRSAHGWWLHCVARGCSGKRDLASEEGPALELLARRPRRIGSA